MLDYRSRAPQAERAHPTDEHFRTIYFALGAACLSALLRSWLPAAESVQSCVAYAQCLCAKLWIST